MVEFDDYNGDYFFEQEENWLEYQSIIDNYDEPTPQEKDSSYNIFTLEQALSTINEIARVNGSLTIAAERATKALEELITTYTRSMNGE